MWRYEKAEEVLGKQFVDFWKEPAMERTSKTCKDHGSTFDRGWTGKRTFSN
jgi:hypothetical protein